MKKSLVENLKLCLLLVSEHAPVIKMCVCVCVCVRACARVRVCPCMYLLVYQYLTCMQRLINFMKHNFLEHVHIFYDSAVVLTSSYYQRVTRTPYPKPKSIGWVLQPYDGLPSHLHFENHTNS